MNEVVNFGKYMFSDIICRALCINIICKNREYEKASKIAKRISFLLAVSWLSSIKGILKWILLFIFNNQTDFHIGSSTIDWFFCYFLFLPFSAYWEVFLFYVYSTNSWGELLSLNLRGDLGQGLHFGRKNTSKVLKHQ